LGGVAVEVVVDEILGSDRTVNPLFEAADAEAARRVTGGRPQRIIDSVGLVPGVVSAVDATEVALEESPLVGQDVTAGGGELAPSVSAPDTDDGRRVLGAVGEDGVVEGVFNFAEAGGRGLDDSSPAFQSPPVVNSRG
jgi:hypothetical protein